MLRQMAFSFLVMAVLPLTALNVPADTVARSQSESPDADEGYLVDRSLRHCTKINT